MPVYDEAASIGAVVEDVVRHVLDLVPESELIVVDDASRDGSGEIVAGLAAVDGRIRLIRNERNEGHGPTIRRGMDASAATWLFHLDSDGQVRVDEFDRLWRLRDGHDLVLGVRARRHDPRHRLVLTRCTRALVSALAMRWVADANVPFKLIRRDLYLHLSPHVPPAAFAPTILLVLGAIRCRARVAEVKITHLPRRQGTSTLHARTLARVVVQCLGETVRFRACPLPHFNPQPPAVPHRG